VNESVTIAGEDAQISGDGDGSVITVRAPDVALTGLAVDGSGGQTRDPEAAREGRADDGGVNGSDDGEVWDTNIQLGYGHGDAGIRAIGAPGLVVDDVTVEANASGLLLREGSHAVVRDLRVDRADSWQDGFMGIAGMGSRVTVTDSAFEGGRDGSPPPCRRLGRPELHVHRQSVRDAPHVHGRRADRRQRVPQRAVRRDHGDDPSLGQRDRRQRRAELQRGVQASGTRTYVGYNTLVGNELGFSTSSRGSLYERNVAANNELGARATTVVPSSRIVANDFVGNADHATAGAGALRSGPTATAGTTGRGKRRGPRARRASVPPDRPGRRCPPPRGRRGRRARVARGRPPRPTPGTVPGARSGSIIDPAPAAEPYSPDRIDAALDPDAGPVRADWRAELGDGSGERRRTQQ